MKYSKLNKLASIFQKKAYLSKDLSEEEYKRMANESKRIFDARKEALMLVKDEEPEVFDEILSELREFIPQVKAECEGCSESYIEAEVMNLAAEILDHPSVIEKMRDR